MISVAVAGLGRVGALYRERPGMPWRTHLSAIAATPGLTLAAIVDPDPSARAAARQRHNIGRNVADAGSLDALPAHVRPAMVVLAGPADTRPEGVAGALARGARLVFCEKPLAGGAVVADTMLKAAADAGAAIRVNFHRRLDPAHVRVRAVFSGRPLAVQIRYANGLENYGSHSIDLLLDWLGPPAKIKAETAVETHNPGFRMLYPGGPEVVATSLNGARYDVFDIDLHYADGRLELANGGTERRVWRPMPGLYYPDYTHLVPDAKASDCGPVAGLGEFYAAARNHLRDGVPLPGCDGAAALMGLRIVAAIRRSAAAGGIWMSLGDGTPNDTE